jgi:hypothetical protein
LRSSPKHAVRVRHLLLLFDFDKRGQLRFLPEKTKVVLPAWRGPGKTIAENSASDSGCGGEPGVGRFVYFRHLMEKMHS